MHLHSTMIQLLRLQFHSAIEIALLAPCALHGLDNVHDGIGRAPTMLLRVHESGWPLCTKLALFFL